MQARPVVPAGETTSRCLLRLKVTAGPRTLAAVVSALADAGVTASQTIQEGGEIVLSTERCEAHRLETAFAAMAAAHLLAQPPKWLRILEEVK